MAENRVPGPIFITGGTGYMGRRLILDLLRRGHLVRTLTRPGSERNLPPGCSVIFGSALDEKSYAREISPARTFVHLVGVPHPSPAKSAEFRRIDLVSAQAAVAAAVAAGIRHFVYVSVAQPAPVMKSYIEVRKEVESTIARSGLNATILCPWYVLGPGHRWPIFLQPIYWLLERLPATRESACRLGLVTIDQMIGALVAAVEQPAEGIRRIEVQEIRRAGKCLHQQ